MAHEIGQKTSKAPLFACGGSLVLLGVAVGGLFFACVDWPVQPQRQADGSTLSLLGYTTANEPELLVGPPLFRLVSSMLPDKQQQWLGVRRLRHPGGALALWLKSSGGDASKRTTAFSMPFQYEQIATVTDNKGRMSALPWPQDFETVRSFDDNPVYRRLILRTLPRRGGDLTVRVYRFDKPITAGPIAVFHLPNPYSGSSQTWAAERLPARRSYGEITVKLHTLQTGIQMTETSPYVTPPFGKQGTWSRAELGVFEDGVATDNWDLERVTIQDATGNTWSAAPEVEVKGRGVRTVLFPGNLWEEPAWKVRMRFERVKGFSPGQTCILDARIPPRGRIKGAEKRVSIGSTQLQFAGAAAMRETWPLSDGSLINISSPTVFVRFNGKQDEDRLALVSVRDSESVWEKITTPVVKDGRTHAYELFFMTPPGPVKLEFARHQVREVEFTVGPERSEDSSTEHAEGSSVEGTKPSEAR